MCNLMKTLILTILTVLILGFITPQKETIFIGTITIDNKYNDKVLGFIEFKIDTLLIAREIIQQDRTFKISVTADKDIDIYFRGIGARDSYIQTIKPTQKDTIFLSFKVPREYKKHFGKVVCPKCNKHDKVVPIIYGLLEGQVCCTAEAGRGVLQEWRVGRDGIVVGHSERRLGTKGAAATGDLTRDHDDQVRAGAGELLGDVVLHAIAYRHQRNHRAHADADAQHGQRCAQLVRQQRLPR